MASFAEKWGYKGRETALNGLTIWMYDNIPLSGSYREKQEYMLKLIIKYAQANISGYKKRGHLITSADYIAKKIQKNGKFKHFTAFIKDITAPATDTGKE